jgi:clan AA aspartic protease
MEVIMGFMKIRGTVRGPRGEETLEFLVDSGAMYTLLPHEVWKKIGLEPDSRQRFSLADGTVVERKLSECLIILSYGKRHSTVILGEPGDQALLGVVTLEEFGMMLNPYKGEIVPMKMLLMPVS